jgi:hypothetical protein
MNRKRFQREQQWLNLGYYPSIYQEGHKITMKIVTKGSWCPNNNLNKVPAKYVPGANFLTGC